MPAGTCKASIAILFLVSALSLGGCSSLLHEGTADLAGVGGAAAATAVTDNALVATGIGLGVRSVASAGLQYGERKVHQAEQDRIAAVAGPLAVGQVARWDISHDVPIEADAQGEVTVSRLIGAPPLACKEIVFSVEGEKDRAFYVAIVCQNGETWKWASAEPATERWGSLQ
jgi:hypothetical protein